MKQLKSGIKVDSDKYYQLLDWKDNNRDKFIWFCNEFVTNTYSINEFTIEQYNALLDIANV